MTDPTYTGGCVECGAALPYGGYVATPLCDACISRPVPREGPVGPFPREPAFGSPEAVEAAAGQIRENSNHAEFSNRLAEQEAERRKAEWEAANSREGVLLAEVERLQGEVSARIAESGRYLEAFKNATESKGAADDRAFQAASRLRDAEEQRDALAYALESLSHFVTRACCGPGQPASGELSSILIRTEEALLKAGR
jgi:hypothetical protein